MQAQGIERERQGPRHTRNMTLLLGKVSKEKSGSACRLGLETIRPSGTSEHTQINRGR